jgi:hypothetical protein
MITIVQTTQTAATEHRPDLRRLIGRIALSTDRRHRTEQAEMIGLGTIHGLSSARLHRLVVAPTSDTMLIVAETMTFEELQDTLKQAS